MTKKKGRKEEIQGAIRRERKKKKKVIESQLHVRKDTGALSLLNKNRRHEDEAMYTNMRDECLAVFWP